MSDIVLSHEQLAHVYTLSLILEGPYSKEKFWVWVVLEEYP